MKQGFVKVAAASCAVVVADVRENTRVILETIHKMEGEGAKVMVLPELALTGYTCSDLFWQSQMIDAAKEGLKEIADGTKETDALIFVGLPWEQGGKLFNVAAVLCHGELLGIVPKKYLPNYNEFYELRHFTPGKEAVTTTEFFGKEVPFGMNLLFQCEKMPRLKVAAELCEDLWTPNPPSVAHALAGATVVVNLSASDEMVGKDSYRRSLVSAQSARLICGYIYATAGEGESTTDLVFGGQHLIAENGTILAEAKRFENQIICADLDVDRLTSERRRMTTYPEQRNDGYQVVRFSLSIEETKLTRYFDPRPFVPSDKHNRDQRCDEILNIQAMGLKKRLAHTHCQSAVIGISGGLDSKGYIRFEKSIKEKWNHCNNGKTCCTDKNNIAEQIVQIIYRGFTRADAWDKAALFFHVICNFHRVEGDGGIEISEENNKDNVENQAQRSNWIGFVKPVVGIQHLDQRSADAFDIRLSDKRQDNRWERHDG